MAWAGLAVGADLTGPRDALRGGAEPPEGQGDRDALGEVTGWENDSARSTSWGWLPAAGPTPGSLLVIETAEASPETLIALGVMQGLVNDRMPSGGQAAYLQVPPMSNCFEYGHFNVWPGIYARKLGIGFTTGRPEDLATLALQRGVRQYVIWNPSVPATINAATTLAWSRGAAAFGPDDAAGPLARGLDLLLDFRSLDLGGPADAYQWVLKQLDGVPVSSLALLPVGDIPGDASEGVASWSARDYAVCARAFAWDADLHGLKFGGRQDPALLESILASVGSGKATMFGWSNDENAQTILSSAHGVNFVGADTPGLRAANLSVHNSIRPRAVQQTLPRAPRLERDGVYASIVFTDGDNIGVLLSCHEGRWESDARGSVPVGWSLQGMAPSWTPGVARYYFDSASFNDELIAWLPFGYPDLRSFRNHPHWDDYVASAHGAMADSGLAVSQDFPHRIYVPSEKGSGLWEMLHGANAPMGHFVGYQNPPGLYPVGEALWIDGRPVLPTGGYAPSGSTASGRAASGISQAATINPNRPLFMVVGLGNCTNYEDAIATVNSQFATPVRFVLPSQLVKLQRRAWRNGWAGTTLLGLPASANVDPYFLTTGDGRSVPALFGSAGLVVMARSVADSGSWVYEFNVERCHSAVLSFTAIGEGVVHAAGDGGYWSRVARVRTRDDEQMTVEAAIADALPSSHLKLRFTAAAGARFSVTSLRLAYNAERHRALIKKNKLPAGSELGQATGPNLIEGVAPFLPSHVAMQPAGGGGRYRLTFQVPPESVTLTGFGGSTWAGWSIPEPLPSEFYLFRLEDMTGRGRVFLDVWNGFVDLPSREVSLSSTPQTVSILVRLPSEVPAEALRAELQVRTYDFPLDVTVTPSVRRVGAPS